MRMFTESLHLSENKLKHFFNIPFSKNSKLFVKIDYQKALADIVVNKALGNLKIMTQK